MPMGVNFYASLRLRQLQCCKRSWRTMRREGARVERVAGRRAARHESRDANTESGTRCRAGDGGITGGDSGSVEERRVANAGQGCLTDADKRRELHIEVGIHHAPPIACFCASVSTFIPG